MKEVAQKTNRKKSKRELKVLSTLNAFLLDLGLATINETTRLEIQKSLYYGIKEAITSGKDEAHICQLNTSIDRLSVPKSSWKTALLSTIPYFEKEEDYVTCHGIKSLIDLID